MDYQEGGGGGVHDTGKGAAQQARPGLGRVGGGRAREQRMVAALNLLYGVLVVVPACPLSLHGRQEREGDRRGNGDVTAVQHAGPRVERVGGKRHVVAAAADTKIHAELSATPLLLHGKGRGGGVPEVEPTGALANARRAEAGAGAVGGAGVEGGAQEGDVELLGVGAQAGEEGQAAKGRDAREDRVGLAARSVASGCEH